MAEAEDVAAAYTDARQQHGAPIVPGDIARGLQLAKLWTAVELLQEDRHHHGLRQTQQWLIAEIPGWLKTWT